MVPHGEMFRVPTENERGPASGPTNLKPRPTLSAAQQREMLQQVKNSRNYVNVVENNMRVAGENEEVIKLFKGNLLSRLGQVEKLIKEGKLREANDELGIINARMNEVSKAYKQIVNGVKENPSLLSEARGTLINQEVAKKLQEQGYELTVNNPRAGYSIRSETGRRTAGFNEKALIKLGFAIKKKEESSSSVEQREEQKPKEEPKPVEREQFDVPRAVFELVSDKDLRFETLKENHVITGLQKGEVVVFTNAQNQAGWLIVNDVSAKEGKATLQIIMPDGTQEIVVQGRAETKDNLNYITISAADLMKVGISSIATKSSVVGLPDIKMRNLDTSGTKRYEFNLQGGDNKVIATITYDPHKRQLSIGEKEGASFHLTDVKGLVQEENGSVTISLNELVRRLSNTYEMLDQMRKEGKLDPEKSDALDKLQSLLNNFITPRGIDTAWNISIFKVGVSEDGNEINREQKGFITEVPAYFSLSTLTLKEAEAAHTTQEERKSVETDKTKGQDRPRIGVRGSHLQGKEETFTGGEVFLSTGRLRLGVGYGESKQKGGEVEIQGQQNADVVRTKSSKGITGSVSYEIHRGFDITARILPPKVGSKDIRVGFGLEGSYGLGRNMELYGTVLYDPKNKAKGILWGAGLDIKF